MAEKYQLENSAIILVNIHDNGTCYNPHSCPIHHKTDHHMRKYPQHYRSDKGIMERICEHGVGHPDPDGDNKNIHSIHGCDGCCQEKTK